MDYQIIGFIVFASTILISRVLNDKAMKKLNQEKKATLIDLHSNKSIYLFILMIAAGIFFVLSEKLKLIDSLLNIVLFIFLLIGLAMIGFFRSYKKLKENDFPESYIRTYLFTTVIKIMGVILLFALTIPR